MSDTAGPLSVLGWKLRSRGLPSLGALIARLGQVEEYGEFVNLVREFLPEREVDILHQSTPPVQIAAFVKYFEERYFPLHDMLRDGDAEEYSQLTNSIPVVVMGISYDYYCEVDSYWRPGDQLMTYLLQDPYQEDRVALAEACAKHVSAEVIQRVPEGGFSREECHHLLDDTPYKGVALWADWLWAETGNFFLDVCEEELWECGGGHPYWDSETVDELTRLWQQAERIQEEVFNIVISLEENPRVRFEEILNFILERKGE